MSRTTTRRDPLSLAGALLWFASSYGGAILGYLAINAFAARMLGDSFGYFVIAVTTSTLLGQLGLLGVHRGGLREAARLQADDLDGLRELRGGVRAVSVVTLPVTSVATAAVTYLVLDEPSPATRWAITIGMGVLVWLGGQQKLWANYLRGFGHVRFASLLEGRSGGALTSVCQGLLMGALLLFYRGAGLPGALAALALGYALPVTIAWRRVSRQWQHVSGHTPLHRDLTRAVTRHWRFASNLLGGYLNSTIEIWLAALILTSRDISLYSAAQRLSVLLVVPLVSLGVVYSPVVSRLVGHDERRLEKLLRTGAALAAAVTAVVWVPMLVAPGALLGAVYGDTFAAAAPVLVLLTLGSLCTVLSGMCGTALMMSRHEGVVATVQWLAVLARTVAGLVAGLVAGVTGLATSAAAVTAILSVSLWLLAHQRMDLWTHPTLRPSLRLMRQTSG